MLFNSFIRNLCSYEHTCEKAWYGHRTEFLGLKELVRECFVHGPLDQVGSGRVCLNGHFTSHKSNVYTCLWVSDTTSAQRWLSGWVGMAK